MKPHYPFIASKNYKGGTTSGCEVQLSNASSYQQPELIPDPLLDLKVASNSGDTT